MIGHKIRNLRIEKGMKQSELAKATGLSRISIGNYERGDRQPPVDAAAKIADALEVTVDYLLKDMIDTSCTPILSALDNDSRSDIDYALCHKIVKGVEQLPEAEQKEIWVLIEAKIQKIEGK